MKNKLSDVNDFLIATLERLNDESENVDMETEIAKSKAINNVASTCVNLASIALKAEKYKAEKFIDNLPEYFK